MPQEQTGLFSTQMPQEQTGPFLHTSFLFQFYTPDFCSTQMLQEHVGPFLHTCFLFPFLHIWFLFYTDATGTGRPLFTHLLSVPFYTSDFCSTQMPPEQAGPFLHTCFLFPFYTSISVLHRCHRSRQAPFYTPAFCSLFTHLISVLHRCYRSRQAPIYTSDFCFTQMPQKQAGPFLHTWFLFYTDATGAGRPLFTHLISVLHRCHRSRQAPF